MNRTVFNPQMTPDGYIRHDMLHIQSRIEAILNTIRYDIHLNVRNSMNEIIYHIDNIRNINWSNEMNNDTYYRGQNAMNSIQNSINNIMNNIRNNINTDIQDEMNNIQNYVNNIRTHMANNRNTNNSSSPSPITLNNELVNNNYKSFLSNTPYLTNLTQTAYYKGFIAGLIVGAMLTMLFISYAASLTASQ